ncbi:hypothetical protein QT497_22250 [Xanthomonas citri pv. citri]
MSKLHVSLVTLLIAGLTACLAGGPAQTEREHAFLQYVKDNGSDDARVIPPLLAFAKSGATRPSPISLLG